MNATDQVVEVIKALTPFITAATPVLLVLAATFQWWVTHKQTKDLKAHSDENREAIKGSIASTSGTYKQL